MLGPAQSCPCQMCFRPGRKLTRRNYSWQLQVTPEPNFNTGFAWLPNCKSGFSRIPRVLSQHFDDLRFWGLVFNVAPSNHRTHSYSRTAQKLPAWKTFGKQQKAFVLSLFVRTHNVSATSGKNSRLVNTFPRENVKIFEILPGGTNLRDLPLKARRNKLHLPWKGSLCDATITEIIPPLLWSVVLSGCSLGNQDQGRK